MRFFDIDSPLMRFLSRVADLVILNLLYIVCCIPIVTIGAATTAMYTVTMRMARKEEGYLVKGFFKAFKDNFKISTIVWLILGVFLTVLFVDFRIVRNIAGKGRQVWAIILMAIGFFVLIEVLYIFPYIARFSNTIKETFKCAIIIGIANLPYTLVLVAIVAAAAAGIFFFTVQALGVAVLCGFSVIAFLSSYILKRIFKKYEPVPEDELEQSVSTEEN